MVVVVLVLVARGCGCGRLLVVVLVLVLVCSLALSVARTTQEGRNWYGQAVPEYSAKAQTFGPSWLATKIHRLQNHV